MTFLYQRTLQSLSMLLRLFVVHTQNHRRHGKSICIICVMGSMEEKKYKFLLLIQTTKDMLDFSKKPGYPVKVMSIEQKLLRSRKYIFLAYQDSV